MPFSNQLDLVKPVQRIAETSQAIAGVKPVNPLTATSDALTGMVKPINPLVPPVTPLTSTSAEATGLVKGVNPALIRQVTPVRTGRISNPLGLQKQYVNPINTLAQQSMKPYFMPANTPRMARSTMGFQRQYINPVSNI